MSLTAKTPSPGRPKDLEKRAAILEAAKLLFPARGYDGVSMDAIAQAAGVSKLTVYSHFQDKDTLFIEAVQARCEELLPSDLFVPRFEGPVRAHLLRIAHAFFRLITSDEAISIHRMMSARTADDSHLPRLFWEAGPKRVQEALTAFLQAEHAAGELHVPDCALAASQFFSLLKGECHARLLCGLQDHFPQAQIDRHVEATVDLFLRAYGPARR
ncbi:TetR/AcrR family transcriptional regulator [Arenimonas terrae]|uniref:TetR/AcrR family transcriptional regulator n=1 Tax=Arenimonas terrae TaxID=2546226 RepID=A0A5C4RNK9_9GAMM|nr:TetR/AcrR family transcriptional regulator [Arenimonas terrae]TNJ32833.1 TetR/AcrR family transcriptional regulator [Arenimonas terrae]